MNGALSTARRDAACDVALVAALFLVAALLAGLLGRLFAEPLRLPATIVMQGAAVLLGAHVLLGLRAERWRDLGLHAPRPIDLPRALLALILCLVLNAALTSCVLALAPDSLHTHFEQLRSLGAGVVGARPWPVVGALMLFVGFYEEVLARGLLLARCRTLLGRPWAAVLASALIFGAAHFYQGWVGVAQTTLVGAVFAALALRWATLWPLILAHAALDLSSLMVIENVRGVP